MRLPDYRRGRRPAQRAAVRITRGLGAELDDVAKVCMRRPDFGRPFLALANAALRGSESWTVGELELFGAVVSQTNTCAFCVGTHGEIAGAELRDSVDEWRAGRFGPRVTAAAEFVEAISRADVGPAHVDRARTAGVSDEALAEAAYVALTFDTINRIANALEFSYRSERDRVRGARILRRNGYRLPGFLLR